MKPNVLGGLITLAILILALIGLGMGFYYIYQTYTEYETEEHFINLGESFYLSSDQILASRIQHTHNQAFWVIKINDERARTLANLKKLYPGKKVAILLDKKPLEAVNLTPDFDPTYIAIPMTSEEALSRRIHLGR